MAQNVFRNLPSVNELLESPPLRRLVDKVSHNLVVSEVRTFLDNLRGDLKSATDEMHLPAPRELAERIAKWIVHEQQPRLRPVINATGILLHTGLGRAPLATEAVEAMAAVAGGYATLEVDPETGERSQRVLSVEKLLCELTGAETATVVNNNAGATLLTLAALAAQREVIVSRGQLIEIGGSYRLPDVMSASGAVLREVGTTNKTRINDYRLACHAETAALMRVHTSNYRVVGFAEEVSLAELVRLGKEKKLTVIDDIGSGALIDFSQFGLTGEPIARDSIAEGAEVVLFSGDKLLGGPQCGIIVGQRALIDRIVAHPLMRALRVDKLTLAALRATLLLYRDPVKLKESVPLLALLATSLDNLKNRAERIAAQIAAASGIASATSQEEVAQLGGGSVPAQPIPTWCVAVVPSEVSLQSLAQMLRTGTPSVFGRLKNERLLLDLRSVMPSQDMHLVSAVTQAAARPQAAVAADDEGRNAE